MKSAATVIGKIIHEIASGQQYDGGFASFSSPNPKDFLNAVQCKTTFFTANILFCLASVDGAEEIKRKAARFLLKEKGEHDSFNYWSRQSPEYTTMPYPDDLDDTFGALAALALYDKSLVDGVVLASAAKMLTAVEVEEGGPYRTWLVSHDSPAEWRDIDIVVNGTIGYFLSLFDVSLPKLERFVDETLRKNGPTSPYYPGPVQVLYFISRFYRGRKRKDIAKMILDFRNHSHEWTNLLESAMAITSLIRLGFPEKVDQKMIDSLVGRIQKDGWKVHAFCIDPAKDGKKCYAGSPALTAAFCVEALSLFLTGQKPGVMHHDGDSEIYVQIHRRIQENAIRDCADLLAELQMLVRNEIEKTSNAKTTELVYRFKDALDKKASKIPDELLDRLALGSLYGWMAYTIYDDILDREKEPTLLLCANLFLRKLTELYGLFERMVPGVGVLFDSAMNAIDAANAWEQAHCRFPAGENLDLIRIPDFGNYGMLADRSIGHALGPMVLLAYLGYASDSEEQKSVEAFFRHYLIARQFHDDAHDWNDDLERGLINSVAALTLSGFRKSSEKDIKVFFWNKAIDEAVRFINSHIAKARQSLEDCDALENKSYFHGQLDALASAAEKTLAERNTAREFLASYKPTKT